VQALLASGESGKFRFGQGLGMRDASRGCTGEEEGWDNPVRFQVKGRVPAF